MNNKVKFAFAMGIFIILVILGAAIMQKNEEVVFYPSEENEEISKICVYVVGEVNNPRSF